MWGLKGAAYRFGIWIKDIGERYRLPALIRMGLWIKERV
jgi:hypothetical protein